MFTVSRLFAALVAICACLVNTGNAQIDRGQASGVMPNPVAGQPNGMEVDLNAEDLHLKVDSRWLGGSTGGYYPVRIKFVNRGPDCKVRFLIKPANPYNNNGAQVIKEIEASQNVQSDILMMIPCVSPNDYFSLEVYKDGKRIEGLETSFSLGQRSSYGAEVGILHLADSPSNVSHLFGNEFLNQHYRFRPHYARLETANLPTSWLPYSTVDVILIAASDFDKRLNQQQQKAILNWVATGGTLIIHDCKSYEDESNSSLDQLLELNNAAAISSQWHVAHRSNKENVYAPLLESQVVQRERSEPRRKPVKAEDNSRMYDPYGHLAHQHQHAEGTIDVSDMVSKWEDESFAIRDYALGEIIRIDQDFVEGDSGDFLWLSNEFTFTNKDWGSRYGMQTRVGGNDFLDFVMRRIRLLPTSAYIGLITLFCLIIGPINYIYFFVKKRLTAMLWSIPFISIIATIMLLAYSSIASGFGTKVKIRSVTVLDQRNQTAVSGTRLAMFCGRSPAQGLKFSADTGVFPIWPREEFLYSGKIDWTESQQLSRTWIPSRTRRQFFLQSVRNERGRIEFIEGTDDAAGNLLSNGLQWKIKRIIISDDQGNKFYAADIVPGKQVALAPMTDENATEFKEILSEQKLQPPVHQTTDRYDFYSPWGYHQQLQYTYSKNFAEKQLTWAKSTALSRFDMKPNSYIAILDEQPSLDIGVESYTVMNEIHLLFGFY